MKYMKQSMRPFLNASATATKVPLMMVLETVLLTLHVMQLLRSVLILQHA